MARPIEPTPTLEGVDAENFYKELERPRSREEIEHKRMMLKQGELIFRRYGQNIIKKMSEMVDAQH